ncbi:AEC family transporter [Caballeronia novacaledonica]|uniref:AEC family transporter n=1 Tax=Caballeronia novacaledonica TaxID=1544861 RepID=UPI001EE22389|nr:AEC family transporter [Caballeronia novacaledonica]GJH13257.1 AEC family transporter [Caballeronia novacaledonica]
MFSVLALALAPTFFVMALGYGAGKSGHIDNSNVRNLNIIVMSYCLPASLFVATATTRWSELLSQWPILLSLSITMMGVYVTWYAYQRWARHQTSTEAALQALAVGQPNYAAAAFPVISALFGVEHLSTVAIGIAVGSLLPSPLTLALLELDGPVQTENRTQLPPSVRVINSTRCKAAARHLSAAVWHAVTKPIVLAPVFGTLFSLSGLQLPNVASASLRQIGVAAGGMGLLVTGIVLSKTHFRLTFNTSLGVCVSNIVQALVAFAICRAVNASPEITKLTVIMAALPSGFFGILFGNSYGRVSSEANSTIIASTLLSSVTLAVSIAWVYSYGG